MFDKLDNVFDGATHLRSSLPPEYISDSGLVDSNSCFVRFNAIIRNLLRGQLIVGSVNKLIKISAAVLSFHDQDGNILQDETGQLLQYTSTPQGLGHFLTFSNGRSNYTYAKLLFQLLSNVNFDPDSIFFHFPRPSLSSSTQSTSIISTTTTEPGKNKESYLK